LIRINQNEIEGYFLRGNYFLQKKDYDRAIQDYNVAKQKGLDLPELFYYSGYTNIKLKNLKEACSDLSEANKGGIELDRKMQRFFSKCLQEIN
jgi:tetratricopeptide (TPR) repeat protein